MFGQILTKVQRFSQKLGQNISQLSGHCSLIVLIMQTPHRTPLRRISQGSLLRLSRSGAYPDAPHGLGFLEPAMSEFIDETETLQTNVEGLKHLSDTLATFNESFASWLYVMNMNALTVDWPQVCADILQRLRLWLSCSKGTSRWQLYTGWETRRCHCSIFILRSFHHTTRLPERNAFAAMQALQAQLQAKSTQPSSIEGSVNDQTTIIADPEATFTMNSNNSSAPAKTKKVVKGKKLKLTAKEKKERAVCNIFLTSLARFCASHSLQAGTGTHHYFSPAWIQRQRSSTLNNGHSQFQLKAPPQNLRRNMEAVIEGMWDAPNQTVKR